MKCPRCGAAGAYVGFRAVECPSPKCPAYRAPAVAAGCPHDWVRQAVIDLCIVEWCSKCPARRRQTVLSAMFDPDHWSVDTRPAAKLFFDAAGVFRVMWSDGSVS